MNAREVQVMVERLRERVAWVFDLDGTLTKAQHDFAAIRKDLGIHARASILEALEAMPEPERQQKRERLDQMEAKLAHHARAADGAVELLEYLRARACRLSILTRNTKANAHVALEVTGLAKFFEPSMVLGRDEAKPKPDPSGILHILKAWGCQPAQAVMVGDYVYDLKAGRNAGTLTVHADATDRFDFADVTDLRTVGLLPLHALLSGSGEGPPPGTDLT